MNTTKYKFLPIFSTLGMMLVTVPAAFAQQAAAADSTAAAQPVQIPKMFFETTTYIWVLLGVILLAVIYTLANTVNVLSKTLEEKTAEAQGKTIASGEYVHRGTAWSKFMQALTRSVPVEKERDVLLDHDYDGIRELDNQLPPWWKWGFYMTILFAFVYVINFHISGSGKLQVAEYNEEMAAANAAKELRLKNDANYVTEATVTRLTDDKSIADGKEIFLKTCVACHGDKGQGNVGPNLTDQYWIHGGGIKNVFATITNGVPAKGMISWKTQLSPKQIQLVGSYILTLAGTNPPGAKDPQGTIWVDPSTAGADSTGVAKDSTATGTDTASVKKG